MCEDGSVRRSLTAPGWLPQLWVVRGCAEAYFLVQLKPAVRLRKERARQAVWPGQKDKQPHTVMRMILGGFMGYSEGRTTLPW